MKKLVKETSERDELDKLDYAYLNRHLVEIPMKSKHVSVQLKEIID